MNLTAAAPSFGPYDRAVSPLRLAFLGDPASVHVQRWLGYFVERGHAVHLIVTAERAGQAEAAAAEAAADAANAMSDGSFAEPSLRGVSIVALAPYPRSRWPLAGIVEARSAMRAAVRAVQPDVLHAQYLTGYGWLARVSGFRPYVVTTWGSDIYLDAPASLKSRLFARLALSAAAMVTADSRDLAAGAIRFGARESAVRIVQFGVDTDRFAPGSDPAALRTRLDLGNRRVILSPRAITPLYAHDTLIRALPDLPDDVVAVFVEYNADAVTVASLRNLAAELDVSHRVRFAPAIRHQDMPDYLRLADVVVSTPRSDGTPVTVLEAMAVGTPVIATDLPSLREWLADLDPEALVPVGDGAALAAAIRAVLSRDRVAAGRTAAAARARVLERASMAANLAWVEARYEALAALPGQP